MIYHSQPHFRFVPTARYTAGARRDTQNIHLVVTIKVIYGATQYLSLPCRQWEKRLQQPRGLKCDSEKKLIELHQINTIRNQVHCS